MAGAEISQIDDAGDHDSTSDEDFTPDAVVPDIETTSSEDERNKPIPLKLRGKIQHKRKRTRHDDVEEAALTSGDEVVIKERQKKRRKGDTSVVGSSGEDGGQGGLIKTRAQRKTEQKERKPLARTDGATVDVEALWIKLSSLPIGRQPDPIVQTTNDNPDDYTMIKRRTNFAGSVTIEERRVLKTSAEARVHIAEQEDSGKSSGRRDPESGDAQNSSLDTAPAPLRRPMKRLSRFEPNPTGEVKGLPPNQQLKWPRNKLVSISDAFAKQNILVNARSLPASDATTKLNTVQKSKFDWATFVDKKGIAEELDEYGKSKQSYAGRADFLNRTEDQREAGRLLAKTKAA